MSEELVKKLRGIAISKENTDFAYGRKAPLYGKETEIEWEAATLIEEQAARIAEAEKDYHEERKARYAAQSELVISQARLSEAVKVLEQAAMYLDGYPEYHDSGMGCGLEDRNITDRYEAMRHGWDSAMDRTYIEHVNPASEAIKAFIATLGETK